MYSAIVNKQSWFEKNQKTLLKNVISTDNQIEDNCLEMIETEDASSWVNIESIYLLY